MTFPSKDGFAVSLDGIIEFKVIPETAAQTYVTYNDVSNDQPGASAIAEEIIAKVIMPNARAFCRLRGSNSSAREFIGGETRMAFQNDFQEAITETCQRTGHRDRAGFDHQDQAAPGDRRTIASSARWRPKS